jgi:Domain of unknown function (DUF4398)
MRARSGVKTLSLVACAALLACATEEPPVAQLSAARTMVSQAQSVGSRYAPAELKVAQDKLGRAEAAMASEDWPQARRLAEEAEVDAKFAWSIAENERTRRASAELAQSIDELKRELEGRVQ